MKVKTMPRGMACVVVAAILATTACKKGGEDQAASQATSEAQLREVGKKAKSLITFVGSLLRKDIVINGMDEKKLLCLNSFYRSKGPYLKRTAEFYKTYYLISKAADFVSIRTSKFALRKSKSAYAAGVVGMLRNLVKSTLTALRIPHLKFVPGRKWVYATYHFPKGKVHTDFLDRAMAEGRILGVTFSRTPAQLDCPNKNPMSIQGNPTVFPLESITVKWDSGEKESHQFWPEGNGSIKPSETKKSYFPPEALNLIY